MGGNVEQFFDKPRSLIAGEGRDLVLRHRLPRRHRLRYSLICHLRRDKPNGSPNGTHRTRNFPGSCSSQHDRQIDLGYLVHSVAFPLQAQDECAAGQFCWLRFASCGVFDCSITDLHLSFGFVVSNHSLMASSHIDIHHLTFACPK